MRVQFDRLIVTNNFGRNYLEIFRAAQSLPYSFSHSSTGTDHPSFLSALHPAFGAAAAAGHASHSLPYYQECDF